MTKLLLSPIPSAPNTDLTSAIEAIKAQYCDDVRLIVQEAAALLFFRYAETPTPTRIHALIRKGSMTVINDAMYAFWEDVRRKSSPRLETPEPPPALLEQFNQTVNAVWQLAYREASAAEEQRESIAQFQQANERCVEAALQVAQLKTALATAQDLSQSAETRLAELQQTLLSEKARAKSENETLNQRLATFTEEKAREIEALVTSRKRMQDELSIAKQAATEAHNQQKASQAQAGREISRISAQNIALSKEVATLRSEIAALRSLPRPLP